MLAPDGSFQCGQLQLWQSKPIYEAPCWLAYKVGGWLAGLNWLDSGVVQFKVSTPDCLESD